MTFCLLVSQKQSYVEPQFPISSQLSGDYIYIDHLKLLWTIRMDDELTLPKYIFKEREVSGESEREKEREREEERDRVRGRDRGIKSLIRCPGPGYVELYSQATMGSAGTFSGRHLYYAR